MRLGRPRLRVELTRPPHPDRVSGAAATAAVPIATDKAIRAEESSKKRAASHALRAGATSRRSGGHAGREPSKRELGGDRLPSPRIQAVTLSSRSANVLSPMPLTSLSWPVDPKPPCSVR